MKIHYLVSSMVLLVACSGDKSLTVQNPAPTADILSHEAGDEILEGFIVNLEGVVSDSNHGPEELITTWKINGTSVCEDIVPETDGSTFCEVVFGPEDTEITLEVRDAENKVGSDIIEVVITETEQPIAEIISPVADGVYYSDQLITFEGLVSDAEDDSELLVAYWESNVDGVLSSVDAVPNNGGEVVGFGNLTEGQHAIQIHVEDTTGKAGQESVIVTVGPPNSDPICAIDAPATNSAGPEGDLVTFEGTVSDVDVPASFLSIGWSSDKDGALGSSSPDSNGLVSFPFADLTVNTHVISMTVTDEVGAECVANVTYTVGTAPSVTIDAPVDGDVISEGTPIAFGATVSDAQDQPDVITLDWVVDGNSISTQSATSSGEATFSDNTLTYGAYNLVVTATDSDGLTDSDQINFTVNGLPSQPVISISPDPATTSDGLNVTIDTASIDPEGSTVSYSYEWQLGGQTQTAYTSSSLPSSATNKGEQWSVIVTPNDGVADGTSGMASIVIANTAPTLSSLAITPAGTTYNDDVLTCSGTVTDPDETPMTTYEWSIGGSVVGTSATLDLSSVGAMPDDVATCTILVEDSNSATDSDSITRTISNRAPTLSGTAITPNTGITTSTELLCETTVADDDGETLTPTFTWSVGSNTYTGSTLTLDSTMVVPSDSIVCTADVQDGFGGTASDTATVNVDNTDPVISNVSITYTGDLTSITLLTCIYTATDADNQTLTPSYSWTNLSTNTPFASSADTLQLDPTTSAPNDVVECSVTVTDTSNGSATLAATETLTNTDPTITTPVISTTGTQVGDTWTCSATGSDQDDGTLTPTYEWQDANGSVLGSSDTLVLSSSNSSPNAAITCVATVIDSLSATVSSSVSETVGNTGPAFDVGAIITPSTGVTTSTSLQCSGSASDADGDTPTLSYGWTNSNGSTFVSTSDTLVLTPSTVLPSETVICIITATDDQLMTATSSATVTVDNTLPSVTASINTNGTNNTGELTCSASATDDDDATSPTITYEWFNSNGSLGSTNPLQLDATMGSDGDVIDCVATATDLTGDTATDTASHTITNTPPVIDSITLSPNTIDANTSSVTCVVSSSDADGDTVTETFAWYVDTQLQSETTNMYSGPFIVGTLLACRATPNDGKIDGNYDEDTATIQNTAPVVDSVSLSSPPIYTNDTITATAVVSDDDATQSGSLTANFDWYVEGSLVQSGADNTLTGTSYFDRDQSVYVTVTPNDGVVDGSPLNSGTVVVSNSVPVISSVTVSPDPATAGQDDLTCDALATDLDGDAIVYTYEWSDSSAVQQTTTEVSDTSDVFLTSGLTEDTWTCDVTPYDGTDYGSPSSASVTVESGCSSLEFDGNDGYILTSTDVASYLNESAWTIDGWFKVGSNNGNSSSFWENGHLFGTSCMYFAVTVQSSGALAFYRWPTSCLGVTPVDDGEWHHVAAVTDNGSGNNTFSLYVDGRLECSMTGIADWTSSQIQGENFYFGSGGGSCGTQSPDDFFDGAMSSLRVSSFERYTSDFLVDSPYTTDLSTTRFLSLDEGSGTMVMDSITGDNHNLVTSGTTWANTCPEEDLDGDGYAAWEDCDDNDATILGEGSGTSQSCTAESCYDILNDGYSTGDGLYWLNPNNSGTLEAYCDMTTDGGGWTLVAGLTNGWSPTDATSPFFTEDLIQDVSGWISNTSGTPLTLSNYGIVKVDDWTLPQKIRYSMNDLGSGLAMNTVIFDDLSSIEHLSQFQIEREFRTGVAVGTSTVFGESVYYYASDYEDVWGYESIFGRLRDLATPQGWQFGLSVNNPDNQAGYDGINDDRDRSEFNLGVAAWQHLANISGYWPGVCTSGCNEDDLISLGSNAAVVQVWHRARVYSDADGDGYVAWEDCDDNDANIYPFAGDTYGDGVDSDCDGLDCEAASDGSTYFAVCPAYENQATAKSRCINSGYDGLAEIHTTSENSFLLNLIQWSTGYHYWLGLEHTGSWNWNSGAPVTFTDWAPGEPSNTGSCSMLWGPSGNPYSNKWNDVWCSNTQDGPQGIGAACEIR